MTSPQEFQNFYNGYVTGDVLQQNIGSPNFPVWEDYMYGGGLSSQPDLAWGTLDYWRWHTPKKVVTSITYFVNKCNSDGSFSGFTNKVPFNTVEEAVEFHRKQVLSVETWWEIVVQYNEE